MNWRTSLGFGFSCFLCLIAGAFFHAKLFPAPMPTPVELGHVYDELTRTQQMIDVTRLEVLQRIEEARAVEVRKVYVQAKRKVKELGTRPDEVARGLVELSTQFRADRRLYETTTSTTVH